MRRSGDLIRMVSRDSAICPLSENCNQIAVQEDHSKMVKFKSRTDPHYERVYSQIKEMVEKHETRLSKTTYTPIQP
jgi:aspartate-semialdehyde dehydrogenase